MTGGTGANGAPVRNPRLSGLPHEFMLGLAVASLTPRQQYIVAVLGEADSIGQAAERLGVHASGLTARLASIAHRLGLAGRGELVALARRYHLLDCCEDAMFGLDANGVCVFANRRTEELFGYSRSEFVGSDAHALIHNRRPNGEYLPPEECGMRRVASGASDEVSSEETMWHRDGHPVWVQYTARAAGETAAGRGVVVTLRDVSRRVQVQQRLELSDARLELALQAAKVAGFQLDLRSEELVTWGNRIELDPGFQYRDLLAMVHPDDRDRLSLELARALPPAQYSDTAFRLLTPTGEQRFMRARLKMVPDESGRPALLLGVVVDETDERDAERMFRAVMDLSSDAFIGMDAFGLVTEWNAAAEQIFGYPRAAAISRPVSELIVPPRYRQVHGEALTRLVDHPVTVSRGPIETTGLRSDGTEIPVELSFTSIPTSEGLALRAFVRDISDRKRYESQLVERVVTDQLTGLPNRVLLQDRLRSALARLPRSDGKLAVLWIDLDRFKLVNDGLGHSVGDLLLTEVARRIRLALRPFDTVARFGGDEFVVLCDETDEHEAVRVAERILRALDSPLSLKGREIAVSASIGITIVDDPDADPESVLSDADAAMYRAKDLGRGRAELFNHAMRERSLARLELESQLRHALAGDELRVFYQPIVDTTTEELVGVEALVRWQHPQRGLLPPSDFIDLAEETGLIVPLGKWVLQTACRDTLSWGSDTAVQVSVNLSGRQMAQPDVVEMITDILRQSGLPPERLCLEITETALMEDTAGAVVVLDRLSSLGVRLAVDDFGTGYSSLLRLRRFPVSVLKLDRLFVSGLGRNPDDAAIVRATADLARALGIVALAEGVEQRDQLDLLKGMGCSLAQGYLWSRPVPAADIAAMLLSGSTISVPSATQGSEAGGPVPAVSALVTTGVLRTVLVDDSDGDRSLLRHTLAGSGRFQIVGEAGSGAEAVAVVAATAPDLVLLDMSLPDQDGLSLLPDLRLASARSRVVVLSGFSSRGLASAASAAGAVACLDKTLSMQGLLDQLSFLSATPM